MPEWLRFWEWMTSNGGESGEVTEADVQAQLNDLDLGNVSTGDICNYFENAYRDAGGHEGGFSYPPAGASPAQAAAYYGQHITVDASQAWHFHADDGAVVNLGNIGGDVITNPELDVDLRFGKGELTDYQEEGEAPEDQDQPPDYEDQGEPPEDQDQPPDYENQGEPTEDQDQPPDQSGHGYEQYQGPIDWDGPHGHGGQPVGDQGEGHQYVRPVEYNEYLDPELGSDLPHGGGAIDPIES
jgi:hypothetical protein